MHRSHVTLYIDTGTMLSVREWAKAYNNGVSMLWIIAICIAPTIYWALTDGREYEALKEAHKKSLDTNELL